MPSIGIDFGGSRMRVSATCGEKVFVLRHRYASKRMPFVAAWTRRDSGDAGCEISSLKRLVDFDSTVPVPPSGCTPLEVLVEMLDHIREECSALGTEKPLQCVLAVPPCFSERQRSALRHAAAHAAFPRVKLVDDTFAALRASEQSMRGHRNILVFSWGAATFSTVLYQLDSGSLTGIAQEGNRSLGGDDVDAALCEAILASFLKAVRDNARTDDSDLLHRIATEAEGAKRTLAEGRPALIPVTRLITHPIGQPARPIVLQRDLLDSTVSRMTAQTLDMVSGVLRAAGGAKPDCVLGVGGMARLPGVIRAVEDRLQVAVSFAEESAVAIGAVMYGLAIPDEEWEKVERRISRFKGEPARHASAPPGAATVGHWTDNFVTLMNTAEERYASGKLGEAIETFDELYSELGKFASELHRRHAAALEAAGRTEAATRVLEAALRRDPSNRLVAAALAESCLRRGTAAHASRDFDRALSLTQQGIDGIRALSEGAKAYAPLLAQLLHVNGCALAGRGRHAQAESRIAEAVRLDPRQQTFAQDLQKVRSALKQAAVPKDPPAVGKSKVGRNDPCPCGSGQKFKKCCGRGA